MGLINLKNCVFLAPISSNQVAHFHGMEKLRSELFALVQPSSLNSGGIKKNQTAEYKNSHFAYSSWSLSASTFPRKFSGLFATFFFFFS